jgi:peptidoglycan/xylan/chitin deacetylase (PgdA/CDA1 family)
MRRAIRLAFAGVAALALVTLLSAVAGLALAAQPGASGHQPLPVRAASLKQDGQDIVWRVRLAQPFSPRALAHAGGSLCLLIERAGNGSIAGHVCIVGPRGHGRRPRLVYAPVTRQGPGRGRVITATVRRTSQEDLIATFLPAEIRIGYRPLRWQVISTLRPPGCVPPIPDRIGCYTLFPARPTLVRLHSPIPVGCVPSGPAFVSHGPSNRHVVALTFDDGPWPDTPQFLSVLERDHVPATFFQIGEQVGTYGRGVDRRMLADGDIIGDHTWNHADVSGDGSFGAAEIAAAAGAIRGMTGFEPCLFRAPGGAVSGALISEARGMGFTTIEWDIDPRDWSRPGTDAIYSTVVSNAHNGAIILQHDGGGDRSETLAALPREIATLRHEGYGFVTVTDLLGERVIYR